MRHGNGNDCKLFAKTNSWSYNVCAYIRFVVYFFCDILSMSSHRICYATPQNHRIDQQMVSNFKIFYDCWNSTSFNTRSCIGCLFIKNEPQPQRPRFKLWATKFHYFECNMRLSWSSGLLHECTASAANVIC